MAADGNAGAPAPAGAAAAPMPVPTCCRPGTGCPHLSLAHGRARCSVQCQQPAYHGVSAVELLFECWLATPTPIRCWRVYGPFNYNGQYTSPSNASFDQWLAQRNPTAPSVISKRWTGWRGAPVSPCRGLMKCRPTTGCWSGAGKRQTSVRECRLRGPLSGGSLNGNSVMASLR